MERRATTLSWDDSLAYLFDTGIETQRVERGPKMRLSGFISKMLQTLAILLCSELLFLPLLCSFGLGLLAIAWLMLVWVHTHPYPAAIKVPEAKSLNSIMW
jgi:hypothetical protein